MEDPRTFGHGAERRRTSDSERSEPGPFPDHELLSVYQQAVEFARWAAGLSFPQGRSHLRDQLVRARSNHCRIARGSLAECGAVLDLLGSQERKAQVRRMDSMLRGLLKV